MALDFWPVRSATQVSERPFASESVTKVHAMHLDWLAGGFTSAVARSSRN
jgi:hypothetical protein